MSARFLEKISGQHETDSILDAYLKPDRFREKLKNKYKLYNYGALKFFIVPRNIIATSSPMRNISYKLKSHVETSIDEFDEDDRRTYFKTEDVDSSSGIVYLANESPCVLQEDINYLRNVEKHAFSLVLSEEKLERPENEEINLNLLKRILNHADKVGTGLFITDQFIEDLNFLQVNPNELPTIGSRFDIIVFNLNTSMIENNTDNLVKILLEGFEKIKAGGIIIIPKSTYGLFPNGRRGVEALLKLLNFKIELPPYGIKEEIVASKR